MKKYLQFFLKSIILLALISTTSIAQVTFGTGTIDVRVDDYGAIRLFTIQGTDTLQQINRISFIAAGNEYQVFDYWKDIDVAVATEAVASPTLSDFETSGTYNNLYSELPPKFVLNQNVYGWKNKNYFLTKCVITNQENVETPILAGLDIIQYVDFTWDGDNIYYDKDNQIFTQYENHYVGIKILSEPTTSAKAFKWYEDYQSSDSNYYNWLHSGSFDTNILTTDSDGGVGILGGESSSLQAGASKTMYFAVAVGSNHVEMLANMAEVSSKYGQLTSVESNYDVVPSDFTLEQNYPNPFNPSTNILFGLPERSNVVLKVFNAIGEEVAELVKGSLDAGTHSYNFDASKLTSGIYLYTLQTSSGIFSKKMMLIK